MNFQKLLYKDMGTKVNDFRKKNNKTQDNLIEDISQKYHYSFDRQRISAIENGKTDPRKNPYLMSSLQLDIFSNMLNIDKTTFIFGDKQDREKLIKLILLSIIMNGDKDRFDKDIQLPFLKSVKNPFEYEQTGHDYLIYQFTDANSHSVFKDENKLLINSEEFNNFINSSFPFFANKENIDKYNILYTGYSKDLLEPSTLLIKLLFGNLKFAKSFIEHFTNINIAYGTFKEEALNLLQNKGVYGSLAIDWTLTYFPQFITAFEELWDNKKDVLMKFFDEQIFRLSNDAHALKKLNDKHFNYVIQSEAFIYLLQELLTVDEYTHDTAIGHNHVRSRIQAALNMNPELNAKRDITSNYYDVNQLGYDIDILTQCYSKLSEDNDVKDIHLFAKRYVDIKTV
ncbi:hypothetical protein [Vagococcus xieshaowenii]|uniref:Uncharacterized protein n=1 Tax=Vagococcus xieshaowenii TaxID=2562451 RepID=A0AAJ5EG25_9ENTE|nr:hypothetical protein [Vagococcus xieshaowenii]QCA29481.1 hypothetical protein E4Z98_09175 [Vagococcus xieshaowenii]TFZ42597.1 hypothetical protein E4031_02575 [Vagococcus xieshaowenii]